MTLRKIDVMYRHYGFGVGRCESCPHFKKKTFDRTYHKCLVYGESNSEATDWRKSWDACGLIDKPFPEKDQRIVNLVAAKREDEKPIPGQLMLTEQGEFIEL